MDSEELKEQIADALENALDDLDEVKIQKRGILLTFMSGDQFRLAVDDLNEDEDETEEEEEEEEE